MSTQRWFGIALGMVLVLCMAAADAQSRRGYHHGRGGCEAIVYQHEGFRGEQFPITGSMPTLGDRWNDRISSIRVISGDWTFYQHDGYRGDQIRVGRDVPDVGGTWNDRISSIQVLSGRWIFYRDRDYGGSEYPVRRRDELPALAGGWNDRISSARCVG